jgi:hypothetical protein
MGFGTAPVGAPAIPGAAPIAPLSGFEAELEAERQRLIGARPAAAPVEEGPRTAFGRGLQRGVPQTLEALSAGAGALGFERAQEYLRGIATEKQMEILRQNPELLEGVDFRDIRGLSSFLTYLGELAGEQTPLIAGTVTTAGAAALAGVSAPVAAVIGTVVASGPLLFGGNVQRQAEVLGVDPSELTSGNVSKAALAAVGQTALEAATNALLVARVGAPIARQLLQNASAEALAEVGQQAIERAQAGLDVDSPEAYEEFLQAGIAGAVLGGAFTGVAAGADIAVGGERARQNAELEADQRRAAEEAARDAARAITAEAPVEVTEAPTSTISPIALPAPEAAPTVTEAEWKKGFRQYARERVRDLQPVRLRDLQLPEVRAIRAARQAQGITNQNRLAAPASLSEIQAVLGTAAAAREVQKQKPMTAQETAFAPIENKSFSQTQFDAVLDAVRATGKINFPEVKNILQRTQQAPVSQQMVNDVLTEASRRGLFQRTAKPRKDGGVRYSYQLSPALTAAQTEGSISQKQMADNRARFEENQREITRLQEEARRIEQTGKTLAGKARKVSAPERKQIAKLERDNRSIAQRMQAITARMGLEPAVRPVPAVELAPAAQRREQTAALQTELAAQQNRAQEAAAAFDPQITELKKRLSEAQKAVARGETQRQADLDAVRGQINELQAQREVARSAALRGETPVAPPMLRYTPRFQRIANNLRGRMDRLGLKDVAVKIEGLLDGDPLVEGVYTPENRVIRLASALHDSKLTDAELEARLSEIMDHELVHALWEMGLFTDAERASLIKAAGERQYVAMIDGKPTKRRYTYLQRAQRMYADQSLEVQQEEAIAEMFRNYAAGRDKFAGRPQNIFKRIINFFKSFSKAATEEGAQGPADIFAGIQRGEVGARERAAQPEAGARESRRVRLPKNLEGFTVLSMYDDAGSFRDLAEYAPNGRRIPRNKEVAIQMMHKGRKRIFSPESPKDINDLARIMAAEAEAALATDRNAIGWYGTTLQKAKQVLSLLHPEIQTDPGANGAMDYAIAVTSNGMAVVDNFINANKQYENWQQTGRFLEEGYGNQGQSMVSAFQFYNALKDKGLSDIDITTYLSQETTPGQLRKDPMIKELGFTVESKEFAATPVRVSYIIGPKIGQGFYQNLRGNFEPLTMDRWWMRMFNRLTGKPFTEVTDDLVQTNINRVLARLRSNEITAFEAELRDKAIANLSIDIVTPETIKDLGIEINRLYQREFTKADKNNRPEKTELFAAADRLAQNATLQLQESPRGPADRMFMREVTNRARDILRAESNVDITNADIQALLWYAEKRLWDAYGVRKGRGEDNDYVDGAIALLRDKGISDERIAEALPAGDRYRIDPRLRAEGPDGGVRGQAVAGGAAEARPGGRPSIAEGGDPRGDAVDQARPDVPVRESRRPEQRPAAETGDADLQPVTADDLRNLSPEFFQRPGWAVVTATREDIDPQSKDRVNKQENDILRYHLQAQGIPYLEMTGTYKGEDQGVSFLIIAPESTAIKLGNQARQESILTNEGLVYTLRPLPTTVATGDIVTGREARAQDFFSETEGGFAFSMGLDFSTGPGISAFPDGTYERTDRPQLPIRESDNMVELFHWSDQPLTSVDPAFAGTGPILGAERRRGARLGFFGINPRSDQRDPGTGYVKENKLGSILHRALVDPDRLYPWTSDPAGFKENLTTRAPNDQISEVEQRIRDAGYLGYYVEDDGNVRNPSAPLGNVAAMFEAIPVEPVRQVRESRRPMYSVTAPMQAASGTSSMTAIQKQVTQYTDIADWFGKAVGVVVRKPGRAQEIADKFIQKTQDSFIPVARMIKELKERGLTIMDTIDPYLQQQLSRSRAGARIDDRKRGIYRNLANAVKQLQVSDAMRDGLIRISRANATKGDGLAKYIFDRTDSNKQALAEIYLYAKHALERNQYVRQIDQANQAGSGMTDAEANAILNWFNSNLTQQNRSAIAQVEAAAQAVVADTNQVRIDGNLISPQVMNVTYNKKGVRAPNFQNYVPLRGVFDDDATDNYSDTFAGRGYNVRGREDRRILGRDAGEYGSDILANLLFQNSNSIIRAEQNKVSLALADLLQSNPQATQSFGRVLARAPQQRILNAAGNVQYSTDPRYKEDPSIVIAKRDGQEIIIQMEDTNLSGAFNGKNVWNAGHANVILQGLGKLNRYLSNIVTSWNPEFVITNLARDIQGAGINVSEFDLPGLRRDVVKNIPSALAGLRAAIRDENFSSQWSQRYREFALAGGQSAANPMATLQDQIDQIDSIIGDFGKGGSLQTMRRNGAKVLQFLEDYNTVVENAVRLTTFDALRKRGFSEQRAAQAARSVTVDFTKTGDMGQFMNSLYLFYNAALQGSFFMFRAAARSKKVRRVLAGAIAMGVVMDMINSMVSGEDEAGIDEYDKIPDYVLEHNWIIMLPEGMAPTGRRYIAIPMPYGLNFFYNTGRAIARTGRGGYDVGQGSASIARTLLEVINPLGGTEHFLNFAAPTIADPFIQILGTNVDFTGRDIVREPFPGQQVAGSHLYWNNTSPTAVAVAQSLNALSGGTPTIGGWADISPNTLEFWFDYVTGGAGRFVQRTLELPGRVADPEQTAEDIIREVPVIRRLFGSVSEREDMGTYIRERDRILLPRAELRAAAEAGDRERIQAVRERFPDELRIAEAVNRIESQRREITRRINDVRSNPRIPEERKQEIIQRLDEQRQRVILRGLQLMRSQ